MINEKLIIVVHVFWQNSYNFLNPIRTLHSVLNLKLLTSVSKNKVNSLANSLWAEPKVTEGKNDITATHSGIRLSLSEGLRARTQIIWLAAHHVVSQNIWNLSKIHVMFVKSNEKASSQEKNKNCEFFFTY